jgi:translation initiation factor 3 subunit H
LGFSNILEELPISFHNSHLVNAMMHEIQDDSDLLDTTVHSGPSASFSIADPSQTSFLSPNFNILELNLEPYIEKSLSQLIESVDEHVSEQNNYAYWQRTVARESARIQQVIQQKVILKHNLYFINY